MTAATQRVVNSLIGLGRGADATSPALRYRWSSLIALEAGDVAAAGVLAQLAIAASVEDVGGELHSQRNT